jgi:hypothetical protein
VSLQDDIGEIEAFAELTEADVMGETITLSHRGAAAVTLKALVGEERVIPEEAGGFMRERRLREFRIAIQTGFTRPTGEADPITSGDVITYDGRLYQVNDAPKLSGSRIYIVQTVQQKTLSTGVS